MSEEFITKYDRKWVPEEEFNKLVALIEEGQRLTCVHRSEKQADYAMEHHDAKDPCDLCTWAQETYDVLEKYGVYDAQVRAESSGTPQGG